MKDKGKYLVAAGVAIIGAAVYFWKSRSRNEQSDVKEKARERHHLTNVFSKAKQVAVGN